MRRLIEGRDKSIVVFNADDEFPNCLMCDLADWCDGKQCGPDWGWSRYKRTTVIENE